MSEKVEPAGPLTTVQIPESVPGSLPFREIELLHVIRSTPAFTDIVPEAVIVTVLVTSGQGASVTNHWNTLSPSDNPVIVVVGLEGS